MEEEEEEEEMEELKVDSSITFILYIVVFTSSCGNDRRNFVIMELFVSAGVVRNNVLSYFSYV